MASEHKQLLTIVYISLGLIAAGTWWDLRWHATHAGTTGQISLRPTACCGLASALPSSSARGDA